MEPGAKHGLTVVSDSVCTVRMERDGVQDMRSREVGEARESTEPLLAPRQLIQPSPPAIIALTAAALLAGMGVWLGAMKGPVATDTGPIANHVPASPSDLATGFVSPVDPANRRAVEGAISHLQLAEPQRKVVARAVFQGQRRLAWIVFTDSIDPDGDVVAVESGGVVQHVTLSKAWTPVSVPLDETKVIGITAVRDGGGGGVTVALATRGGPVALRTMVPGERIEVAAP